jgi:hypothetical protein
MTQALAYSQECTLTIENSDIRVPIELITDQYVFNDYFRCVSTWTPNQTSVDAGQSVFLVYQNLLNNERIGILKNIQPTKNESAPHQQLITAYDIYQD